MQIRLNQREIELAIVAYVNRFVGFAVEQPMEIDLEATRGPKGYTATVEVGSPRPLATPVNQTAPIQPTDTVAVRDKTRGPFTDQSSEELRDKIQASLDEARAKQAAPALEPVVYTTPVVDTITTGEPNPSEPVEDEAVEAPVPETVDTPVEEEQATDESQDDVSEVEDAQEPMNLDEGTEPEVLIDGEPVVEGEPNSDNAPVEQSPASEASEDVTPEVASEAVEEEVQVNPTQEEVSASSETDTTSTTTEPSSTGQDSESKQAETKVEPVTTGTTDQPLPARKSLFKNFNNT